MGVIRLKRGNNVNFAGVNLEVGEPVFVVDTGKFYIGDGTNKILINGDVTNVATATKLQTSRLIGVTGDATGSVGFDGSVNSTISLVLANTGVSANTYTKVTVDTKGRIISATNLSVADIPTLSLAKISDAGTAASKNIGTASGNIPILDASGKLDVGVLPSIVLTDTFVIATEVAMLALTAQTGDVAVRTDLRKSYILKTAPATVLANWQELLTPTDVVSSVAGRTGAVTLAKGDVGLANVDNTTDALKPVSTAQQTALNLKANLTVATSGADGLMDKSDKAKLDAIAANANNYIHPSSDGHLHVPATGADSGQKVLTAGEEPGILYWADVYRESQVSTTSDGLMIAADKVKLNGIASGAQVNSVTSVAGRTGAVTLAKGDVGLANVDNTTDALKPVSTAQQTALNLKANLASPTFTGVPIVPTAATATNTTQVASTAFVKAQGYLTASDTIDGGTF